MVCVRLHYRQVLLALVASALLAGCRTTSNTRSNGVSLPIPPGLEKTNGRGAFAITTQPVASRYLVPGQTHIDLTPIKVIHLTFENSAEIKSAYLRYVAEKARYDYIIATWTSSTPGIAVGPGYEHSVDVTDTITNRRTQRAEAFLERNFVDTSRLRVYGAALNEDSGDAHAYHPSAGSLFRFPLWGSREALQRSSEQIFQQNRVNDAQLEYVQKVREQIRATVATFFAILGIRQRAEAYQRLIDDLQAIHDRLGAASPAASRPASQAQDDRQRLQAEIVSAGTELRGQQSNYAIEVTWFKTAVGLPLDLELSFVEEPFDPFGDASQGDMVALSMRTDPEIATLQNAIKDAQVQLALARKGRLDIAVQVGAATDLRGSGYWTGRQEYRADANLSVRFIDQRISSSLEREASATVHRHQRGIQKRRNEVYVEAVEPMIQAKGQARKIIDTGRNIEQYRRDFAGGVQDYFAGRMNIDDLIRRRQGLLQEEIQLISAKAHLGESMADLASATGKYFELLEQEPAALHTAPASQPAAPTPPVAASRPATQPAPTSQPNLVDRRSSHAGERLPDPIGSSSFRLQTRDLFGRSFP